MVTQEEIINLLRKNPPRINLVRFLQNKQWTRERGECGRFPNCAGTVLFVLNKDFEAKPGYRSTEDMARFIEESGWPEGRENGGVFWVRGENVKNDHFGIYLGEIDKRWIIFHQRNYGDIVSIDSIPPDWGSNLGYQIKFYVTPEFVENDLKGVL